MTEHSIQPGDIALLGAAAPEWARGTLLLIEEVRAWGVIGIVHGLSGDEYPIRIPLEAITAVYRKIA